MTGLHLAAYFGIDNAVQYLLGSNSPDSKDSYSRTPLLEKGADIESKNKDGWTPLTWAASRGDSAIVKLLLEKAADIESKDTDGRTPLSWAASHGDWASVQLLLKNSVASNISNTPIQYCITQYEQCI
jgi:ankyrin repeat protein